MKPLTTTVSVCVITIGICWAIWRDVDRAVCDAVWGGR